jgi:type IV fimbrial biogenesis protein FimT
MNRTNSVSQRRNLPNIKRLAGFTLVELLITVSIVAILATVAVPSYRYVTNSNRVAAEVNGLLGDLQFARSQAIKEGIPVIICVSSDGSNCTGETDWKNGWIIQSTTNGIMRKQTTFKSTDSFQASNSVTSITFNREGFAGGIPSGSQIILQDATSNNAWTRCLTITTVGQMWTQPYGQTVHSTACPSP